MALSVQQLQAMARQTATKYGLDPALFMGLVDQESSWTVNATTPGSSAFGLTQVTNAAQQDVGVTRSQLLNNPQAQLDAGAAYLKKQLDTFGNYALAFAGYNQGAGNANSQAGKDYASSVAAKSKKYLTLDDGRDWLDNAESKMLQVLGVSKGAADTLTDSNASVADVAGAAFDGWFGRIAIGVFALLLIGAALFMLAPRTLGKVAAVAAN